MNRISAILMTLAATSIGSAALAQVQGGPAPGTVDSKQVTRDNRETQAEYNRTVSSKDQRPEKKKKASAVAATAADVTVGSSVSDSKGVAIGTIESVDADGAVVATGTTKVEVPLIAFGKNDEGLLLGITKAEFDALVAGAAAG